MRSVKVHAPPGGGSNWNMGWDDNNSQTQQPAQRRDYGHANANQGQSNIFGYDEVSRNEPMRSMAQDMQTFGGVHKIKSSENNIGETNNTSVKVHAPPGGKSNWSIGGGFEDHQPVNRAQKSNPNQSNNNIFGGYEEPKTFGQINPGRSEANIGETNLTSVRVHAPPGGGSNFSLAHDQNPNSANYQNSQQNQGYGNSNNRFGQGQNQGGFQHNNILSHENPDVHTSVRVRAPPGKQTKIVSDS